MKESKPYRLDEPREIVLKVHRGPTLFSLTHRIDQPSAQQWNRYFEQAAITRREKRQLVIEDRSAEVAGEMYGDKIRSVEGYLAGGQPLDRLENWAEKIPLAHKIRVLERLGEVESASSEASEDSGFELGASNERSVTLLAPDGEENLRLIHRFRFPDASRLRRFEADRASRRIKPNGESIGSGWLLAAVRLYDDSILAIEGYEPADPAQVPALHKKAAIDSLLGASDRWAESGESGDEWEKN